MRIVIGLSHGHDSACGVLCDGRLKAAVQEDRFSRVAQTSGLPVSAFTYCLEEAGVGVDAIAAMACVEPPLQRDDATAVCREIRDALGYEGEIVFYDRQRARAAVTKGFAAFEEAAGDAGAAIGAALLCDRSLAGSEPDTIDHLFLGPGYSCDEIRATLHDSPIRFRHFHANIDRLIANVAGRLAKGEVVGWLQGRMELGSRALGGRSILADPRDAAMRARVNQLTKTGDADRPLASVVPADAFGAWFEGADNPFAMRRCRVQQPERIPAAIDADGESRPQSISAEIAPRLHALLHAFAAITGCPVLLQTPLSEDGEPLACTPADAIRAFVRCDLDALVLEDMVVDRSDVPPAIRETVRQA